MTERIIQHTDIRQRMGTKRIGVENRGNHQEDWALNDVQRVTFSEWFRLLSDKTQVHGIHGTAITRSRLTHSLEVARIAEQIGRSIIRRIPGDDPQLINDVGSTLHAAALLHDIGNPPFGHSGEEHISRFFQSNPIGRAAIAPLSPTWRAQMRHMEGNAQALRYALSLAGWNNDATMGLTSATISAFCKYPWTANPRIALDAEHHKYGIGYEHLSSFNAIAADCHTTKIDEHTWRRHPLAYISEAADDIAYGVADIEDAVRLNIITIQEAQDLLFPIIPNEQVQRAITMDHPSHRIGYIRNKAIEQLICETIDYIVPHLPAMMSGEHPGNIVRACIPAAAQMKRISIFSYQYLYQNTKRIRQDSQAQESITFILEKLTHALTHRETRHIPTRSPYLKIAGLEHAPFTRKDWLIALRDMITGQTDHSLLHMYNDMQQIQEPII